VNAERDDMVGSEVGSEVAEEPQPVEAVGAIWIDATHQLEGEGEASEASDPPAWADGAAGVPEAPAGVADDTGDFSAEEADPADATIDDDGAEQDLSDATGDEEGEEVPGRPRQECTANLSAAEAAAARKNDAGFAPLVGGVSLEELAAMSERMNLLGSSIGGCRLDDQLGSGSMGSVYRATHLSLDKIVAVKVLNPALFHARKHVDQFFFEARAAAVIDHPNIVTVFDVGQERGFYYIIMQFIEGESLDDLIRREGTLEPAEVIRIGIEAASGLRTAHEEGVVHRDIKPANLMLTKRREVKIADFGVAYREGMNFDKKNDSEVIGTPSYMPPEQIEGSEVDHRADLYALGATLYYAATGHKPFEGSSPVEVLKKHLNEQVIPPERIEPGVPPALGRIIVKCLKKKREERYEDSEALIDDLRDCRDLIRTVERTGAGSGTVAIYHDPDDPTVSYSPYGLPNFLEPVPEPTGTATGFGDEALSPDETADLPEGPGPDDTSESKS